MVQTIQSSLSVWTFIYTPDVRKWRGKQEGQLYLSQTELEKEGINKWQASGPKEEMATYIADLLS